MSKSIVNKDSWSLALRNYAMNENSTKLVFLYKILTFCLILIPLTSSLHTIIPIPLTRIIVIFVFLSLIAYVFLNNNNKTFFFLFFYLITVLLYSSICSSNYFSENLEDFIYFSMAILVFFLSCDKQLASSLIDNIQKRKNLIKIIIFLTILINIIAVILNNGTYDTDGAFKGYTVVSHSIATIFIYSIVLLIACKEKNFIWYLAPIYFIFISQARTFLIPLCILIIIYFNSFINNKKIKVFLFIALIVVFAIIFPSTSMYDKFIVTNNQWGGLTNSRSVFWEADMNSFTNDYNPFEMLFGKGFSWVRTVNQSVTSSRIWAHNDFINVLLSVGIIGEIIYFGLIFRIIKNHSFFNGLLLAIYILIPAFINGFYDYFMLVISVLIVSQLLGERKNAK